VLEITENPVTGTVIFAVRVQPRANKDEIAGEIAGTLKIRLQAPALDGRANEAVVEFLAELLKTTKGAVRILSGERSRIKRLEIRGITKQQIERLVMRDA
jgi:uncharacterized protein